MRVFLVTLITLLWLTGSITQAQEPDLATRVVVLTNGLRADLGLPPLKLNASLTQAAQGHADSMAGQAFFAHANPHSGSVASSRIEAAGYSWRAIGENIAAGQPTPEDVVASWITSPDHYANLTSADFWEIGLGYTFDSADTFTNGGATPLVHYWAQNFGTPQNRFPIVIDREAWMTTSDVIELYIYGEGWAQEMRLRDDGSGFSDWIPYSPTYDWVLSDGMGERAATVELRNADEVVSSSDTILRVADGVPPAQLAPLIDLPDNLPQPQPDVITIEKVPDPVHLLPGEETEITLTLSGGLPPACAGIPGKPLDALVVFDRSSSAGSGEGSNLEMSKTALLTFLDNLQQPVFSAEDPNALAPTPDQSRMGLITSAVDVSGPIPFLEQALSVEYDELGETIAAIDFAGDSELASGVDLAVDSFPAGNGKRARAIMLVLHDNLPFANAIPNIESARAQGIDVYVLINNLNIEVEERLDLMDVEEVVGREHVLILESADPAPLRQLFIHASDGAIGQSGQTLVLHETLQGNSGIEVVRVAGNGQREANNLRWSFDSLTPDQPVTVRYTMRLPANATAINAELDTSLQFIDCNGYLHTLQLSNQPVELGPTPTPTATPPPTPTPTPLGVFFEPTPGATPTPGAEAPLIERVLPTSPVWSFCQDWWWLPALILPLLALLLYWLWLRSIGSSIREEWRAKSWRCWLSSLLFWLYALFFLFLLGWELFAGFCGSVESVYFWRLDQGLFGRSGVYLTAPGNAEETVGPTAFDAVNQSNNCVGCHTVSSSAEAIAFIDGVPPNSVRIFQLNGEPVDIPAITASFLAWSPDGTQLAFDGDDGDISVIDVGSGVVRTVDGASEPDVVEVMPAWSADGSQIAFARQPGSTRYTFALESPSSLYTVPAAGGEALPIPGANDNRFSYYPAFSPDGKWLAFTAHDGNQSYADPAAEIFLVAATGGDPIRLAANDRTAGEALPSASNSWPTWSRDGRLLAFNSKRDDESFDIFLTEIDENGQSGVAVPLAGAAEPGVFEHIPFWGTPIQSAPLLDRLLALWPWLIPLLLLWLLSWLLCRQREIAEEIVLPPHDGGYPLPPPLTPWQPTPLWDPAPTLIIGLGGSGRHILTHIKKHLLSAGLGAWPSQVRLILLDSAEVESVGGQQKPVEFAGVSLAESEKLIFDENLQQLVQGMIQDVDAQPELRGWFSAEEYTVNLRDGDYALDGGTRGRRPLARAALFRQLQAGGRRSALWRWLQENVQAATEDGRVHVHIVGSAAGGVGSGLLADIAYLTRRSADALGIDTVLVEGFVVTDGAFEKVSSADQLRSNTAATLRELNRFQLAAGRPYPIVYEKDSAESLLNGYMRASAFDALTLIDNTAQWATHSPDVTVFPAVADLLSFLIDRSSRSPDHGVAPYRANVQGSAAGLQAEYGEAAVSIMGSYVYRLPFLDVIKALRTRFARDLLALLLTGEQHDHALSIDAAQNSEATKSQSIALAADEILRGYREVQPPQEARLLNQFANSSIDKTNEKQLNDYLNLMTAKSVDAYVTPRREGYHIYLTEAIQLVLNGRSDSHLLAARSGKIGYALALLKQIADQLKRGKGHLQDMQHRLRSDLANQVEMLILLADAFVEATEALRANLLAQGAWLTDSVSPYLQAEGTAFESQRTQMRGIKVRHYFCDEAWLDAVYKTYLEPHLLGTSEVSGVLGQLFWQPVGDGKALRLTIRTDKDALAEGEVAPFAAHLGALADGGLHTLWQQRNTLLAAQLSSGVLGSDEIADTAEKLVMRAAPLGSIRRDASDITKIQANHFLYANTTISEREALSERTMEWIDRVAQHLVTATDPFTLQYIASRDVIPLSALSVWPRVTNTYRQQQLNRRGWQEPLHVFSAEKNAIRYETRLGELSQDMRFFTPLFVAALENEARAQTFALAVAVGWIIPHYVNATQYIYRLKVDDIDVTLTNEADANGWFAPLVIGMHIFVLGHPDPHEAHRQHSVAALAELVEAALWRDAEWLRQQVDRFSTRQDSTWAVELGKIGGRDLLAFIELVIRDTKRRR